MATLLLGKGEESMHKILILGAGNIGSLATCLLASTDDYKIFLLDQGEPRDDLKKILNKVEFIQADINDDQTAQTIFEQHKIETIISCLPYFANKHVATLAKTYDLNYFDLTEDVEVAEYIKVLAQGCENIFMPRCGLAPGFISIIASSMIQKFEDVKRAELRVGNLPININNALQYALTWSTDGLINEYGNIGYGLLNAQKTPMEPLEDLEELEIDGLSYEAFNTSGGVGSLVDTYAGKVKLLNYKTVRYPGHCKKMRFLMKDLHLNEDRRTLKKILEHTLPKTAQDVALIYVAITGHKENQLISETYVNKIYPQSFLDINWTAIQIATASALCAVVDIVLKNIQKYKGLVLQEDIPLEDFLANRFGKVYI